MKIVNLCGIANSGKTTLFNGITGKGEKVGNWYGVTTRAAVGFFYLQSGEKAAIKDLPGSYFDGWTLDGAVAKKEVEKNSVTIVVAEAAEIVKSLEVYKKVRALSDKVAVVVNMYGELKKRGGYINFKRLKQILGCEIIEAEVCTKEGINAVNRLIGRLFDKNYHAEQYKLSDFASVLQVITVPEAKLSQLDLFLLRGNNFAFCFLIFSALALYLAFGNYGVGKPLSSAISLLLERAFVSPLRGALSYAGALDFLKVFLCDGIADSLVALISFLPPLAVMQFFVIVATESGVLARAAFCCDKIFGFCGLSGRAIFTFLTGYGCTAAGAFAAEGLEGRGSKTRATLALGFIPCSAKTPVIMYLLSVIGVSCGFLVLVAFFAAGLLFALLFSALDRLLKGEKRKPLVIELPPYRVPKFKTVCKSLQNFLKGFIIKTGFTVFVVAAFVKLAGEITPNFAFTENIENSLLAFAGKKLAFVFYPAGITDWRFGLAALGGLFAKEGVVSVITACGGLQASKAQLAGFLLFCVTYSPCFTALVAIKKSSGIKCALHAFFFHNALALCVFYACASPVFGALVLAGIAVFGVVLFFIKIKKKSAPCKSQRQSLRQNSAAK